METISLLEIPDILYNWIDSFLYLPAVSKYAAGFIHFLPRTVWTIIETICGFDKVYHVNMGLLPMMGRNDVGGTSTKNLVHWMQNFRSGRFAEFDYGSSKNFELYGSSTAKDYDLASLKTNLANTKILLFTGENDVLVNSKDLKTLISNLPSDMKSIQVVDYNHLDYMWADDVNDNINGYVMDFLASL